MLVRKMLKKIIKKKYIVAILIKLKYKANKYGINNYPDFK